MTFFFMITVIITIMMIVAMAAMIMFMFMARDKSLCVWHMPHIVLRNEHFVFGAMNIFGIVFVIMIMTRERGVECQLYVCWASFPPQPKIPCKRTIYNP